MLAKTHLDDPKVHRMFWEKYTFRMFKSCYTSHKTNTTFHKKTIILTVKHSGSVNVWGCCPLGSLCGPVSLDLNQTEMLWHGLKHAGKPFIVAFCKFCTRLSFSMEGDICHIDHLCAPLPSGPLAAAVA